MRSFPATSRFQVLVGHLEGDQGHRVYLTPPMGGRALVEAFRVGERAALSYGFDAHIIPKAAATASDLQTIRTILHEKLGTKAKLQAA
jgi:hypothetical protein